MNTLGEAAMDLPWLAPSVASILALTRSHLPTIRSQLRTDPGFVLLSARCMQSHSDLEMALLDTLLSQSSNFHVGFVDWSQPGPDMIQRTCCRQAMLACNLADLLGCDSQRAWTAAFLAPIGWLAAAATQPAKVKEHLEHSRDAVDSTDWQRSTWGLDHTALARRLTRAWRLPTWLAPIVGHLGMPVSIAERLGADPHLFRITQLAVLLTAEREHGPRIAVGADADALVDALQLGPNEAAQCIEAAWKAEIPAQRWESPADHALLPEVLRLALDNRRQNGAAWIERLHQDIDQLQDALVQQCAKETDRLRSQKLSALAEFAAGAGHEINNPLAVISGQAQYVLKQMDWLDVPAEEIENVGEYLGGLRDKIVPSMQKIIAQTQRVHAILTDLMQFARPASPKPQRHAVRGMVQEVVSAQQALAKDRRVGLLYTEPGNEEFVHVDPKQVTIALNALVRNAVEAAPADGWVRVRIEKQGPGMLDLIVEDNGGGPPTATREHLFDPFFSGRSAGRGRGLGLPTAWRLAQQQGGDVRFDGAGDGVTRFVLTLPLASTPGPHVNGAGYHTDSNGHNGAAMSIETNR